MPVHLLWGMTQDVAEAQQEVSALTPLLEVIENLPDPEGDELVPVVIIDSED